MTPFWMAVIGVCSATILLLTGCTPPNTFANGAVEDIFLAKPETIIPGKLPPLHISNDVGGDIVVLTARDDEVATDVIATSIGADIERARIAAQDHVTLTNRITQVLIQRLNDPNNNLVDHALLHLRVPPGTIIAEANTHKGNIEIYGAVGDVTALISTSGNIEVRGANGDVNLQTERGSIVVDLPPRAKTRISAQAKEGNIEIMAVNATISATTTGGSIRFVGTLLGDRANTFGTTAGGNVAVAVPAINTGAAQAYRIFASTSRSPIITDFPANQKDSQDALIICGVIYSPGPYHYDVANTSAKFGRLQISAPPTTTFFLTGTLTSKYYRFETNQTQISFFAPRSQAIHIYTSADLARIAAGKVPVDADCEKALKDDPNPPAAVVLNLRSGTGRIFFHHIDLNQ